MTDRQVSYAEADAARRFLGAGRATDVTSCSHMLDYLEAGSDPEISPQELAFVVIGHRDDLWTTYTSYPHAGSEALCLNLSEEVVRGAVSFGLEVSGALSSDLTDGPVVIETLDRETHASDPDAGIVAVPLRRRVLSTGDLDLTEASIQRRKWRPVIESGPSSDDDL